MAHCNGKYIEQYINNNRNLIRMLLKMQSEQGLHFPIFTMKKCTPFIMLFNWHAQLLVCIPYEAKLLNITHDKARLIDRVYYRECYQN